MSCRRERTPATRVKTNAMVPSAPARATPNSGTSVTWCSVVTRAGISSSNLSSLKSLLKSASALAETGSMRSTSTICGTLSLPVTARTASNVTTETLLRSPSPIGGTSTVPTTVSARSCVVPSSGTSNSLPSAENVTVPPTPTARSCAVRPPRAISVAVSGRRPLSTVGGAVPAGSITIMWLSTPSRNAIPAAATVWRATRVSCLIWFSVPSGRSKLVLPITTSQFQPWRVGTLYRRSIPPIHMLTVPIATSPITHVAIPCTAVDDRRPCLPSNAN